MSLQQCLIFIIEPFVQITEALGGEEWITITMVQPLLHKLLNNFTIRVTIDKDNEESYV